eukprot:716360-Lingulodinium_polyedra.AAC.1
MHPRIGGGTVKANWTLWLPLALTAATEVPPCPTVALYGRTISKSLLGAWWGRWAGRTTSRCPIETELKAVAKSTNAARTNEILAAWLAKFDWHRRLLEPHDAARWLVT